MPRKKTQAETIADFKEKFGDRYDYSQVNYVNNDTKVVVICHKKDPLTGKEHGPFLVTPKNHKKGRGCPKCAKNHPMDTAEFIRKAEHAHKNDDYDYSQTVYKTEHVPVKIICHKKDENGIEHGIFEQDPNAHLKGAGCPKCAMPKRYTKYANALRAKHGQETSMKRYGHKNIMQVPGYAQAVADSMPCAVAPKENIMHALDRIYGLDTFSAEQLKYLRTHWDLLKHKKLPSFKSMISHFLSTGHLSPAQDDDYSEKSQATSRVRYGADMYVKSKYYQDRKQEIVQKATDTKNKNGTFKSSKVEDQIYEWLCAHFGKDDVIRQYQSDAYPDPCDFYIKSRNLYIEVNGHAFHDYHWFNDHSREDRMAMRRLKSKKDGFSHAKYMTWVENDPRRRANARKNHLNYIVFWDTYPETAYDYKLWVQLGYPDGQDWHRIYSWVPQDMRDEWIRKRPKM